MKYFKQNLSLSVALLITVLFEITLIALVYQKIGADQLPMQLVRLGLQVTFLLLLMEKESKIIMYLLTFYHLFTAMALFSSFLEVDVIGKSIVVYHLVLMLLIYFYSVIDEKLNPSKHKEPS
jgi:hypothetical protein